MDYSGGRVWSPTAVGMGVTISCASVSSSFAAGPSIWRSCLIGQQWSPVSFVNCTIEDAVEDGFAVAGALFSESVPADQIRDFALSQVRRPLIIIIELLLLMVTRWRHY